MCNREGWVSNIRCHLSHRTLVSLPPALPVHGPHHLLSSQEHCWTQPGQSRRQGICYREGHCILLHTVTAEDEQRHRKAKTSVNFICFGYYSAFKHHYSDISTTLLLTTTLIFNSRFEKIIFQACYQRI